MMYIILYTCNYYFISVAGGQNAIATRGGHSHRRRVQSCDRGQDAVKQSRHFLGVGQTVKQCAGALSTALLAIKRRG